MLAKEKFENNKKMFILTDSNIKSSVIEFAESQWESFMGLMETFQCAISALEAYAEKISAKVLLTTKSISLRIPTDDGISLVTFSKEGANKFTQAFKCHELKFA